MAIWEALPCGCQIRSEEVGAERQFQVRPCRASCPNYVFIQEETGRQGKAIRFQYEGAH